MSDFFAMGGYAIYVWPSFAISFLLLAGLALVSIRSYREQQALLTSLEAEDDEKPAPAASDKAG